MIRLALCQLRTELDQAETMTKAHRMVREAAQNGAEIIVFDFAAEKICASF